MCEYCGCQALTSIKELTAEHETVVNLIGVVRDAHRLGDVARMAAAARRIGDVLGPHTRVEENGLFPALAGDFPEKIAALEQEHQVIHDVISKAAHGMPPDPDWPQRLLGVLPLLRAHILKEQDGVFPAALVLLSPGQWEEVEAVRAGIVAEAHVPSA